MISSIDGLPTDYLQDLDFYGIVEEPRPVVQGWTLMAERVIESLGWNPKLRLFQQGNHSILGTHIAKAVLVLPVRS